MHFTANVPPKNTTVVVIMMARGVGKYFEIDLLVELLLVFTPWIF